MGEDALLVSYEDGRLQSLDPVTGGLRWEQRLPARASSPPTAGASGAGQGLAWVGGADGALHALDLRDGTPRWRHQTAAPIYAAPLVTPDALYVPSGDGTLAALTPADGKELWRLTAVGPLTGRPALAGQRLYFGSADGRIHCVDAATGAELWGSGIVAQGMVESQPVIVDGRVLHGRG